MKGCQSETHNAAYNRLSANELPGDAAEKILLAMPDIVQAVAATPDAAEQLEEFAQKAAAVELEPALTAKAAPR